MPENFEIFQPMTNLKFEQMVDVYGVPCDVQEIRTFRDGRRLGVGYALCDLGTWFVYDSEHDPTAANGRWHQHCGPYSTFEQAKDWIQGIREVA
jgi:hypothetical protein